MAPRVTNVNAKFLPACPGGLGSHFDWKPAVDLTDDTSS
jgi:hypothetical protein